MFMDVTIVKTSVLFKLMYVFNTIVVSVKKNSNKIYEEDKNVKRLALLVV